MECGSRKARWRVHLRGNWRRPFPISPVFKGNPLSSKRPSLGAYQPIINITQLFVVGRISFSYVTRKYREIAWNVNKRTSKIRESREIRERDVNKQTGDINKFALSKKLSRTVAFRCCSIFNLTLIISFILLFPRIFHFPRLNYTYDKLSECNAHSCASLNLNFPS